ncbi:ABC transporter permease subunit [Neobacillus sp. Marseille-QA0830]
MKMVTFLRKLLAFILQCLFAVEVLILITVLPVLFDNISFHFYDYVQAVFDLNVKVFTFGDFTTVDQKNSLFPIIFIKYWDSMKMLAMGVVTASLIAFAISYLAFLFFRNRLKQLKNFLEIAESIPDLMLILLLQLFVIIVYKQTGIKLAHVVTVREEAILLPVICLSVPISFYITKVMIHAIEEELEKPYILLAKAKGLQFSYILNVHVLRNIAEGMFGTSKTILWSMLSTLLVIDYLFNMNGLLRIMLTYSDPFFIGCILIFIPFFLVFRIYEWISFSKRKEIQ